MDFSSRNVIVTGSARGIGFAVAAKLLEKGSKVLLTDIDLDVVKEAHKELEKQYGEKVKYLDFSCDVTSPQNYKRAFEVCECKFGKPNLLVNNAGGGDEKNIHKTLALNLEGPIIGTEIAIEYMGKHEGGPGGNVVNMASISGVRSAPCIPFYSTAKTGLVGYTRNVGHPFISTRTGVNVQCLCPNAVDTPMLRNVSIGIARDEVCYAQALQFFNLPKLQPEEVASALISLLEDGKPGAVMCIEHGKEPYYHVI